MPTVKVKTRTPKAVLILDALTALVVHLVAKLPPQELEEHARDLAVVEEFITARRRSLPSAQSEGEER